MVTSHTFSFDLLKNCVGNITVTGICSNYVSINSLSYEQVIKCNIIGRKVRLQFSYDSYPVAKGTISGYGDNKIYLTDLYNDESTDYAKRILFTPEVCGSASSTGVYTSYGVNTGGPYIKLGTGGGKQIYVSFDWEIIDTYNQSGLLLLGFIGDSDIYTSYYEANGEKIRPVASLDGWYPSNGTYPSKMSGSYSGSLLLTNRNTDDVQSATYLILTWIDGSVSHAYPVTLNITNIKFTNCDGNTEYECSEIRVIPLTAFDRLQLIFDEIT